MNDGVIEGTLLVVTKTSFVTVTKDVRATVIKAHFSGIELLKVAGYRVTADSSDV